MDPRASESFLDLAEQASGALRGPDAAAAFGQFEQHYGDLLEAMQCFIDQGRTDEALRLVNALAPLWTTKQRFDEGSMWFDRVLGLPGGKDPHRGGAFVHAGFMAFWKGEDNRAYALYTRALEIGRQIPDPAITSRALGGLARVALRSDVAEARRLAREALVVSEAAADRLGCSNAIHLLGVAAQMAGDLLEARDWMSQRLALMREMKNEAGISSEAGNLSMVERQLGNLEPAEALVREALSIADRLGDEFMKPFALSGLAAVATDRGEFERAATMVGAAEAMMEARGAAWPPDERPHYERMLAALPDAMGAAAFERVRAAGHSMSSPEAVAFALGTRPAG